MNRYRFWEDGDRYPSKKAAPPEHGIKVKKAGTSWWGQRWLDALQATLGADSGRLARGKTYARAGRTHDLEIKQGKVSARVTGSRAEPYKITIQLQTLPPDTWRSVIAGMAAKAQFAAELLAGQMPKELDEVFRAAGSSLFPVERADLVTSCSCPDWGDPCKHVAATHYVLGEALDRDPFLLFELRGRSKEQVLEALRVARGAQPSPTRGETAPRKKPRAKTEASKRPRSAKRALVSAADYEQPGAPLPSLGFSFDAPEQPGALLRQLGAPQSWAGAGSPADSLIPLVHAAAERARQLALASTTESAGAREDVDPER